MPTNRDFPKVGEVIVNYHSGSGGTSISMRRITHAYPRANGVHFNIPGIQCGLDYEDGCWTNDTHPVNIFWGDDLQLQNTALPKPVADFLQAISRLPQIGARIKVDTLDWTIGPFEIDSISASDYGVPDMEKFGVRLAMVGINIEVKIRNGQPARWYFNGQPVQAIWS